MSIRAMSLVWDNFNRGGSEKLAMLALADWCNDAGSSLHPSISAIAKKINVSDCQARRIIHGFINDGFLSVVANLNGGAKGDTRHYILNINKLSTPSTHDTPSTHARASTHARIGLAPIHVTPSTHASLTTIEPSIEPLLKTKAKKTSVFVLPEWIEKQHWDIWHQVPKRKKSTDEQKLLAVKQLQEWREAGIDYALALKNSAMNGWQGLFEPKINYQQAPPNRKDYQKSTTDAAYEKLFGSQLTERDVTNESTRI